MTLVSLHDLSLANAAFGRVLLGLEGAEALLHAVAAILPVSACFAVVNHRNAAPIYLADSYKTSQAKAAVQRYVDGTYLLNPVWNAIHQGLGAGIYRMADLAPDQWGLSEGDHNITEAQAEEIGFLTTGWPTGQAEVSILTHLQEGIVAELSVARPTEDGGFSDEMIETLVAFKPLIDAAQMALWRGLSPTTRQNDQRSLDVFGRDQLSPREAEIVQLVLKGHSNISISLTLGIAVPTVKTHRQNAYGKLGITTQQELFFCFLTWAQLA
jgi:DNA-binding CsgD family transcriptional regulator